MWDPVGEGPGGCGTQWVRDPVGEGPGHFPVAHFYL